MGIEQEGQKILSEIEFIREIRVLVETSAPAAAPPSMKSSTMLVFLAFLSDIVPLAHTQVSTGQRGSGTHTRSHQAKKANTCSEHDDAIGRIYPQHNTQAQHYIR